MNGPLYAIILFVCITAFIIFICILMGNNSEDESFEQTPPITPSSSE